MCWAGCQRLEANALAGFLQRDFLILDLSIQLSLLKTAKANEILEFFGIQSFE